MNRNSPCAVVLGGTGFVGGHVCEGFARAGYHVTSVSRRQGDRASGSHVSCDLEVATPREVAAVLAPLEPDVVVNAAGSYWGADAQQMTRAFTGITQAAVNGVAEHLPGRPRFVHLGSVMEYAPTAPYVATDESTPVEPQSAYGRAKLAATEVFLKACADGLIDGVALRVTNNIGAGAHRGSLLGMVATQLAAAEKSGGTARLELSPMQACRDYLDVADLADAVIAAAQRGCAGDVVNIGTGTALPVRRLVDRLIELSEVPAQIVELESAPKSPGSTSIWLAVDPTTAQTRFGWSARRGVDDALRAVWAEARLHEQ